MEVFLASSTLASVVVATGFSTSMAFAFVFRGFAKFGRHGVLGDRRTKEMFYLAKVCLVPF